MSCNEATRSRTDSSLRRSGSALVLTLLAIACVTSNALPQSARRTAHHKPPRAASKQPAGEVKSLERIAARADFDRLSRIYYRGRFYALPHLMFVIDRRDHDRVYYI